jgi:hypothetical protein
LHGPSTRGQARGGSGCTLGLAGAHPHDPDAPFIAAATLDVEAHVATASCSLRAMAASNQVVRPVLLVAGAAVQHLARRL